MSAYTKGEVVGAVLRNSGETVVHGAKVVVKGTANTVRGTKQAGTAFWQGLKSGFANPNQRLQRNQKSNESLDQVQIIEIVRN